MVNHLNLEAWSLRDSPPEVFDLFLVVLDVCLQVQLCSQNPVFETPAH